MSDYMFQCLQNQQFGYYTSNAASSIIGGKDPSSSSSSSLSLPPSSSLSVRGGDFITSPELGQIFGEMLGVWVVSIWELLGCPARWQLLELGPGKGTLAKDVLRTVAKFPEAIKGASVQLCETSYTMREEQIKKLQVENIVKQDMETNKKTKETIKAAATAAGLSLNPPDQSSPSSSSTTPSPSSNSNDFEKSELLIQSLLDLSHSPDLIMHGEIPLSTLSSSSSSSTAAASSSSSSGPSIPIHWHSKLSQVSVDGGPLIVLAHEFLDALPVYQFQMTERGWCEKLVDVDEGKGSAHTQTKQ